MKKIFLSMLAFTMAAFTFTSCEDVPEPYEIPGNNGGGNTTVEGVYIDQDFSKSLGDFKSVGTNENISWGIDYSSACITGYKDYNGDGTKENQAGVTYLVSPEVDLTNSTEAYVSINHAINYEKADINANNSVLISKDYNGDVNTATWEALAYNTDGLGSSFTFVTKKVAIPAEYVNGKVYIALRHTCSASQSSTWEVKSVSVKEGTVEDETPETGDNSKEKPYTVAYAIANNSGNAWVKGYIVGWIEGQVLAEGAKFNGNSSVKTNILIADDANETDLSKCMPVQLPTGTVRNALNLQDNPNNYKQEVILYGSLEKYFGAAGLKSVSEFVLNNGGGNEEQPPVEEGTPSGDGTVDNPFNSVAANQLAASLGNGETTDKDYYIKGKVVSIKENFTTQYGNATFYISDNGKSDNQFYVFRALYLNNEKYTSGDVLSVGDEVVVCGKLTNYMGNTPETVQGQAYIYSWSKNSGGNTGDDDDNTGEGTTDNGDFEAWKDGQPVNWKTSSTAGNATLSQSTDAHGGSYSVKVGGTATANKRLGYKEIELKAGDYTMTFYAKAATATGASVRPGYVQVTDGKVGTYMYGDYTNDIKNTEWIQITHTFNIASNGTYSLVIMNSKNPGADVLIDDFILKKGNETIIK